MMKKNYIILIALLVLTGFVYSCDDEFIEKDPHGDMSNEKSLSTFGNLVRSTNGLYANFIKSSMYVEYMLIAPDVMADNFTISKKYASGRYKTELNLAFKNNDCPDKTFTRSYFMIASACKVINKIESGKFDKENGTDAQINYLKGEALFVRALGHFQLCNFFAQHYTINDSKVAKGSDGKGGHLGVPIILNPDLGSPARNTVKQVYDQVIKDLIEAAKLMTGTPKDACFKASSNAAKALLSRVYLYKEDWDNAAAMATDVISSNAYALTEASAYENYWVEQGAKETIFEIEVNAAHPYWEGGSNNVGGVLLYYKDLAASRNFVNLFDDSDVRKKLFKKDLGGVDEYHVWKYPGRTSTDAAVNYEINNPKVLRLAEIYLNRAEANFKSGKEAVGQSPLKDINLLRSKRGLTDITTITANVIALERRKELAYEGHRIFDLARNKKDNIRPECPAAPKVIYPNYRYISPIPLAEMDNNENMIQNDGY